MQLVEPYRPRPVVPLAPFAEGGWRLKVYGIAYAGAAPRAELERAARAAARAVLPVPAGGEGRYGVGFLGVHDGRGACFVFVDWWADENELHHRVLISPASDPATLVDRTGAGPAACVWDLAVVCHERRAWIDHVLANPAGPDVEGYLGEYLEGDV